VSQLKCSEAFYLTNGEATIFLSTPSTVFVIKYFEIHVDPSFELGN